MNNLEHLTGHAMRKEPPAVIDDTQRPTWNAVIAEYRNIGEEIIKDDIIIYLSVERNILMTFPA